MMVMVMRLMAICVLLARVATRVGRPKCVFARCAVRGVSQVRQMRQVAKWARRPEFDSVSTRIRRGFDGGRG